MSQQRDLEGYGSQDSEAGVEQPGVEQAGVEGAGAEGAGGEGGSAGEAWSGRAIGPLSGLLPGGAVDLTADEMPAPAATSPPATSTPAPSPPATAGANGDEAVLAADDAQPAEATQATAPTEPDRTGTDDRWHSVLVGFVDDPRGSVEAARTLIDEDIAAHVALLARGREAMHAAWQANRDADTEALRLALVHYRDLRKKLADVVAALSVGTPAMSHSRGSVASGNPGDVP